MRRPDRYYVARAKGYASGVAKGRIPAGQFTRLAARRFLDDLGARSRFRLDPAAAGRACRFLEQMPLTKGDGARQKKRLILEPWQCFIAVNLFGFVRRDTGLRRFREAYVKIPRKNGKSEFAAAIGLYMLAADGEVGAEVFCGGWGEEQSKKVFSAAAQMVRQHPRLADALGLEIWGPRRDPESITVLKQNAKMQKLVAKPGDGDNPSCYICDEYHEHKTDEQYDTMTTGMVARDQSLTFIITTAGQSIGGPCYRYETDVKTQLQAGTIPDRIFVLIYEIDEEDDWRSDAAITKANPNLGVSVLYSELAAARDRALAAPNKRNVYKAKHLNLWVGAETGYFDMEAWIKAGRKPLSRDGFKGRRIWLGLDLATKVDFCALALWALREDDGGFDLWTRFWLPEARVEEKPEGHDFRVWTAPGRDGAPPAVEMTDGAMIDFSVIEEDIWNIWSEADAVDLAFDPAHAADIISRLMRRGVSCVEYGSSAKNLSDPMQLLDGYIRQGRVRHDNNPAMNWMMGNVVNKSKRLDLHYPGRNVADANIDGPYAMMLAAGRQVYAPAPVAPVVFRVR